MSSMKISVLVPAYNERQTIAIVLDQLTRLELPNYEVVIVDDGSTDGTADFVRQWIADHPEMRLFEQLVNQGKTAAIARAIREASGDIMIIQDADLEYDPQEIPDVVGPILKNRADVVYGSRFLVKRAARVLYFYHYLANKLLTLFSNVLTNRNMSDIETCYKAFRSDVIRPMQLTSRAFGMEVEITAMICKTKARTYEVPISYYGRTYEEGKKIGYLDGVYALWYIIYYNLIHPQTAAGRAYVETVNKSLEQQRP
jgi:glycosyltransferase involved in cell wall biosynthesis